MTLLTCAALRTWLLRARSCLAGIHRVKQNQRHEIIMPQDAGRSDFGRARWPSTPMRLHAGRRSFLRAAARGLQPAFTFPTMKFLRPYPVLRWRLQVPCVPARHFSDAFDSIARLMWWFGTRQFAKGRALYRAAAAVPLGLHLCVAGLTCFSRVTTFT